MKNILILIGFLLIAISELSAEAKLVIYQNNGSTKTYNISEIQNMEFKSITNDNIMKVYYRATETIYYPVASIDSMKFETLQLGADSLVLYVLGTARKISLNEIDSVTLYKLEPKIKDDVIVIDAVKSNDIIAANTNNIIFVQGSSVAANLSIGKIFASEPIEDIAPDGFLRRVIKITDEGQDIVVETENAKITDVVENGIVSFSREFSPADTGKITIELKDDHILANEGFTISFSDIVIYDYDKNSKTTNDQIKIDGANTFNPTIGFNIVIENWQLKQVLVQLTVKNTLELSANATLAYTAELEKSLNELLGIPKIKLPSITIWLGWFPFVITSNIEVMTGCELNIAASVSTGISLEAIATAGVEYNSGNFNPIGSFSSNFSFDPPELSIGGSVKGYVGPQINVNFYNVPEALNAKASVFGFAELEVSLLSKPLWQLWAGIEAGAGIESEWFDIDYTLPISLELRKLLAQANDLIDEISPTEGKIGDTITITGTSFGDLRGANYVGFKTGTSLLSVVRATNYPLWSDEEIQVVIPNGVSTGNAKLILDLGGFLANMMDFKITELPKPPRIDVINPSSARVGDIVTISGAYFGSSRNTSTLMFNNIIATEFTSWSNTQIKVKVPAGAITGKLFLTVNEMKSNEFNFTVIIPNTQIETITIGTQVWMKKNLDVDKYNNGDPIPQCHDANEWRSLTTGAWCYYNNDPSSGEVYGKLYNWYAVNDPRGLAPEGFHVASDGEWTTLENTLGGASVAGGKLKESGTLHWLKPNTGATNSSSFTALPGGWRRSSNGTFSSIKNSGYWWTSSQNASTYAWYRGLSYNNTNLVRSDYVKVYGFSVRCIKD